MDVGTILNAIRTYGLKAAMSRSPFSLTPVSPLGLSIQTLEAVPHTQDQYDSKHRHAEIVRKAIMDSVNGQPAPGRELGAGLPRTQDAIHSGVKWLQQHADPNPQLYGTPPANAAPAGPIAPIAPIAPANAASATPAPPGLFPSYFNPSTYSIPIPGMQTPNNPMPAPPMSTGGIGSDHSNMPWQTAAPAAVPPAPAPIPPGPPLSLAPDNPGPSSPFFGQGFGAGDNSAFMSPANMGEGSTIASPGLLASLAKLFR